MNEIQLIVSLITVLIMIAGLLYTKSQQEQIKRQQGELRGRIDGEVITRLQYNESDLKEVKLAMARVAETRANEHHRLSEEINALRERFAVLEYRVSSIDERTKSGRQ